MALLCRDSYQFQVLWTCLYPPGWRGNFITYITSHHITSVTSHHIHYPYVLFVAPHRRKEKESSQEIPNQASSASPLDLMFCGDICPERRAQRNRSAAYPCSGTKVKCTGVQPAEWRQNRPSVVGFDTKGQLVKHGFTRQHVTNTPCLHL